MTAYAIQDSATMLRRNLRRTLRYPASAAATVGIPIVFLLLFVFVFGDTLGAGLTGASGGRDEYLDYVTPGILVLAVAGAAQGTAIAVAMDMSEGIIARFRTMSIARVSVLTGHVVGSLIQTLIAIAIVLGVALAMGFAPTAGPARVGRGDRPADDGHLRGDLAGRRARAGLEERRDREQPADAADHPALPRQRVRPDRLDAGRDALVRREPALHADHGDRCAGC